MNHKCVNCGAVVAANLPACGYCHTPRPDFEGDLLRDLLALQRKAFIAYRKGDKLALRPLLAEDYVGVEVDEDEETQVSKNDLLEVDRIDPSFLAYAASDEKLLDATPDRARVFCHEILTRKVAAPFDPTISWKVVTDFVWREGHWQILKQHRTTYE